MSSPAADRPAGARVHLSLNVRDLGRAVEFYSAFLGVAPHKERPGYANFALDEPPLKLALNECPDVRREPGGALNHLGFQVTSAEAVAVARDRLIAAGLATFDEGDTTCCYARQDKVWAHDPDGNAWEIYVITDDREDDHDHDHRGTALSPDQPTPSTAGAVTLLTLGNAPGRPGPTCCK